MTAPKNPNQRRNLTTPKLIEIAGGLSASISNNNSKERTMTYSSLPDPILQEDFYAGTPMKRLFAWFIDMIVIVVLSAFVVPFTAFTGIFFFPLLVLVIGFAYRVVMIANGSATLGMHMLSIQLRTREGDTFGFGQALLHALGYSISMSMPLIQVVSIVMMLTTSRGQSLTDMIMGSVVINKPSRH